MKYRLLVSLLLITLYSSQSFSAIGAGHVSGKISNITSITSGILVRIGANETPQNCTSNNVWMLIKEENKSIISLTLTAWTIGKNVTVYTSPASTGYCEIWQVDPSES